MYKKTADDFDKEPCQRPPNMVITDIVTLFSWKYRRDGINARLYREVLYLLCVQLRSCFKK